MSKRQELAVKRHTAAVAKGSGDNDGGAISSSFTRTIAFSACFPFPLRVPFVFPLLVLDELSPRFWAEFEREREGDSRSMGIAKGSESGMVNTDDSARIPSVTRVSEGEGTAFRLRAEAR